MTSTVLLHPANIERLIDAPDGSQGIEKHVTITARDVQIIASLRELLVEANADERDAMQINGDLYGDLTTALKNLLSKILGSDLAGAMAYEYLLDTYGGRAETEDSLRGGLRDYGREYGWIPVVTWSE